MHTRVDPLTSILAVLARPFQILTTSCILGTMVTQGLSGSKFSMLSQPIDLVGVERAQWSISEFYLVVGFKACIMVFGTVRKGLISLQQFLFLKTS